MLGLFPRTLRVLFLVGLVAVLVAVFMVGPGREVLLVAAPLVVVFRMVLKFRLVDLGNLRWLSARQATLGLFLVLLVVQGLLVGCATSLLTTLPV
jgi:hypothetical protein